MNAINHENQSMTLKRQFIERNANLTSATTT
jgi:hypothetical protein